MMRWKNFKLEDLSVSYTADINGIDNTIPEKYLQNAYDILDFVQGLRDFYRKPININSGYRSEDLNKAVRGSKMSSHLFAMAVDISPNHSEDFNEFVEIVKEYAKDKAFDQIIIERNKNSRWVHIGLNHPVYGQRKQLFKMVVH